MAGPSNRVTAAIWTPPEVESTTLVSADRHRERDVHVDKLVSERDNQAAEVPEKALLTFAREADELVLEREIVRDDVVLTVILNDRPLRRYVSRDLSMALRRQAWLERSLIAFEWSFVGHLPERRGRGSGRRRVARPTDRRRFWTSGYVDGIKL